MSAQRETKTKINNRTNSLVYLTGSIFAGQSENLDMSKSNAILRHNSIVLATPRFRVE